MEFITVAMKPQAPVMDFGLHTILPFHFGSSRSLKLRGACAGGTRLVLKAIERMLRLSAIQRLLGSASVGGRPFALGISKVAPWPPCSTGPTPSTIDQTSACTRP